MKHRLLGRSGCVVAETGFGAWAIDGFRGPRSAPDAKTALHRALDLGVNFIDTATGCRAGRSKRLNRQVLEKRGVLVFNT